MKTAVLGVLGALGLVAGVFLALRVGSFVDYSPMPLAALAGAVVGASPGVGFLDWRTILALAGAVGFGVGILAGDLLRAFSRKQGPSQASSWRESSGEPRWASR